MRITLLGATGRTGALVITEAQARGHQVIAFARNPGRLDNDVVITVKATSATRTPSADGLSVTAIGPGSSPGRPVWWVPLIVPIGVRPGA